MLFPNIFFVYITPPLFIVIFCVDVVIVFITELLKDLYNPISVTETTTFKTESSKSKVFLGKFLLVLFSIFFLIFN